MALPRNLKGVIGETVKTFIGFNETTIVSAALNCITQGYDKKKAVDKLSDLLDSGQATLLADKIYTVYEGYRSSNPLGKRKRKKGEGEEAEGVKVKKRRFMDGDESTAIPGPSRPTPSPGGLAAEKIIQMMGNARRQLQERRVQMGIQIPGQSGTPTPAPAAAPAKPPLPAPSPSSKVSAFSHPEI